MLLQHLDQALGDALRQHDRNLGADAQEFDVLDGPQAPQQPVELFVADAERIAARQQDVAHFGMRFEIAERLFPLARRKLIFAARIAHQARARAIAAIGRTGARRQEQDAVGIAVHKTRHDSVVVFAQRIVRLAGHTHEFIAGHDVGAAQRFARVVQPHQACVIGRDPDGQRALMALDGAALVVRKLENPGQFVQRADAGAELPMPVVPFDGRRAGIEAAVESLGFRIDREAESRLCLA